MNVMHDVWYQYGFDEASGNSKRIIMDLGVGNDHVNADAQDGSIINQRV
jgi:hypothetical protein